MTINPGRKKKPAGKKITKNINENSPPVVDATGDDGDEHNAGDHDGGIKGNDSDNGLDVTCYDGDRFKAGDNSIKGNDACVDVTLDNRDVVISGNDEISIKSTVKELIPATTTITMAMQATWVMMSMKSTMAT